ncbi:CCR4-not transcription complex, putative [Entamoeba invadens IP1]|uniref:CCR4-not transcription complex, putative n=1 Tax=Entamoeba invadens IP1 TaxID=370355 RepID=A0A0A1UBY2_ENTIV|nr:CCR4-not transcription complex, putative [Entamoeba invadens IP1]ELP92720.1 CCR4-not transcription complex, putative [Entamoeba invadens IP1]|eukprot:XP_004259491.1 CCR4-not transcription complex, putative [Entamoeba invadens IP1]
MSGDNLVGQMVQLVSTIQNNLFKKQYGPVKAPLYNKRPGNSTTITYPTSLDEFSFSSRPISNNAFHLEINEEVAHKFTDKLQAHDWDEIISQLDDQNHNTPTPTLAHQILKMYYATNTRPFPINLFIAPWKNPQTQLHYLLSFAFDGDLFPDVIEPICSMYSLSKISVIGTIYCILQCNPAAFPLVASINSPPTIIALGKYFHFLLSSNNFLEVEKMLPLFPSATAAALKNEINASPIMKNAIVRYLSSSKAPLDSFNMLGIKTLDGVFISLSLVKNNVVSMKGWATACRWAKEIVRCNEDEIRGYFNEDLANRAIAAFSVETGELISKIEVVEIRTLFNSIGGLSKMSKMNGKKEYELFIKLILNSCDKIFENEEDAIFVGDIVGDIIEESILPVHLIVHLLKNVYQSLQRPGTQFEFGVAALKKFWRKMRQWKTYGRMVLENKRLISKHQDIIKQVVMRSETIPYVTNEEVSQRVSELKTLSTEVYQLMKSVFELFEDNSVAAINQFVAYSKSKAITGIADIIVYMSLAKIDLLPRFLELIDGHHKVLHSQLWNFVVGELDRVIKRLLSQQLTPVDAVVLHRTGVIMGKVTLGKNRPILTKRFDLKYLLRDSLSHTWCCDFVFFVIQIVKEARGVFTRQNPWLVKILMTLRAVYDAMPPSTAIYGELHKLFVQFPCDLTIELKNEEKRVIATSEIAGELLNIEAIVKRGVTQKYVEAYYGRRLTTPMWTDSNFPTFFPSFLITEVFGRSEWVVIFSLIYEIFSVKFSEKKAQSVESVVSLLRLTVIRDTKRSPREIAKRCVLSFVAKMGRMVFLTQATGVISKIVKTELDKWRLGFDEKMREGDINSAKKEEISFGVVCHTPQLFEKWVIAPFEEFCVAKFVDDCMKTTTRRVVEEIERRDTLPFDDKINSYLTHPQMIARTALLPSQQILYDFEEVECTLYGNLPAKREHQLFKKIEIGKNSDSELEAISKSLDMEYSYGLYAYCFLDEMIEEKKAFDENVLSGHLFGVTSRSASLVRALDSLFEGLFWVLLKNSQDNEITSKIRGIVEYFHTQFVNGERDEKEQNAFFTCVGRFMKNSEPKGMPGFAYNWVDMITPSFIVNRVENAPEKFTELTKNLLQFVSNIIGNEKDIPHSILVFYASVLRIVAVIRHDFPEYLAEYFVDYLEVIPYRLGQLRSFVLTATPPGLNFSVNIAFNENECVHVPPIIKSKLAFAAEGEVDAFIYSGEERLLPLILEKVKCDYLRLATYLAQKREDKIHSDSISQLLYYLVFNLDVAERDLMLNAIVDNLRFPNSHTLYFSVIIQMFFSANEVLAEQITKILMERLLVSKPLQVGVVVTVIELINVKRYDLTNKDFFKKCKKLCSLLGIH